jgi:AraC-like DNA-binding protein
VFTHGQTSPSRLARPAERLSDGYDNFIFVHFMKGRWQGEADGRPFTLREGEIILLDASRPFHGDATASSYAMVNVPRAVLSELAPAMPQMHGRILDTASGWLLANHLAALTRALPQMHQAEAERMANATLTLMAACVGGLTDGSHGDVGSLIPAVRLRVERHIERHLASADLTPQTLCHDLQIPRSTLYRAFSPFGGIGAYIQSRRLDAARALLFHPEDKRSVEEIARRLGFGNTTSFSRSFQRRFGCTPREARRNGSTFVASSQVLFERWQSVLRARA